MSDKPFAPSYAPEGEIAVKTNCWTCKGCSRNEDAACGSITSYCDPNRRPDGHSAILVRKPSAPASSPLLALLAKLVDVQKQLLDMAGKLSTVADHDVLNTKYELDEMLKKVREWNVTEHRQGARQGGSNE